MAPQLGETIFSSKGGMILGQLVNEVKLWNTPVIGAYLLWMFTKGYCDYHPHGDAPIGLHHFIASAILTSKKLLKPISNRRDNLQSFARSFENDYDSDLLLTIQNRILNKREFTLKAIDIAVANGLLVWDVETGKLYPHDPIKRPNRGKSLKRFLKRDGQKAEILGKWFSQHDLLTIAAYLKVVY